MTQTAILDKHPGFAAIRQNGIDQILGTDMKKHFDITSRFQVSFPGPLTLNKVTTACSVETDQSDLQ